MTRGDLVRTREKNAMQRRRARAFGCGEVGVAGRKREAVALAYCRHGDNTSLQIEVPRHLRDHLELLIILFAEGRDVGFALDEKLRDDGRDAGEKMRPERIF